MLLFIGFNNFPTVFLLKIPQPRQDRDGGGGRLVMLPSKTASLNLIPDPNDLAEQRDRFHSLSSGQACKPQETVQNDTRKEPPKSLAMEIPVPFSGES